MEKGIKLNRIDDLTNVSTIAKVVDVDLRDYNAININPDVLLRIHSIERASISNHNPAIVKNL